MSAPIITLLTDFGLEDAFVGVCHAVIARICPEAKVIDLTHGIPPQDVRAGALTLVRTLPFLPVGVHVAVVDPGVGSARRAVAVRSGDRRTFVGPDNGLLWPALEAAGYAREAVEISRSQVRLEPVSATFHGRDIFSPVAAHLARGHALAELGEPLDPVTLTRLELPAARIEGRALEATVMLIDRFGNLQLNCRSEEAERIGLRPGDGLQVEVSEVSHRTGKAAHRARFVLAFAAADAGELIAYIDSSGWLALAVNRGSAAERLVVSAGDELRLQHGAAAGGTLS